MVTADVKTKTYGEKDPELTATVTPKKVDGKTPVKPDDGYDIQYELTRVAGETVENSPYTITAEGAEEQGNYHVSYETGKLTITKAGRPGDNGKKLSVTSYKGEYDGNEHTITVNNTVEGDQIQYSYDGGTTWVDELKEYTDVTKTADGGFGAVTIQVKVTNSNYDDAEILKGTVEITHKAVTVTANSDSKLYGKKDPDSIKTATVTGTLGNDAENLVYTVEREQGEIVKSYKVEAKGEELQGNYKITYKDGTFTINAADRGTANQIQVTDYDGVYDAAGHTIEVTGLLEDDEVQYSYDGGTTWTDDLKTYTNVTRGEDGSNVPVSIQVKVTNPNYKEATANGTVTIRPFEIVITADDKGKTYGEDDPELTATVTPKEVDGPVKPDDGYDIQYELSRVEGENVGTYDITCDINVDQGNYVVEYQKGTLTIGKRSITITADTISKKYDGETLKAGSSITSGSLLNGERYTATVLGEQKWVGSHESTVDEDTIVIIKIATDEDITNNYDISCVPGLLTVTDEDENGPVEGKLVITKTHTPKSGGFEYGDTVEFTISITNIFEKSMTVTLKELEDVVFDDIENDDITSNKLKAAWKNAKSKISGSNEKTFTIAAGETKEINVYYTIDIGDIIAGEFINQAVVTLNGKEYEAEDKVKTKELSTKYTVDKVITDADPDKVYEVDDVIHYQITVTSEASVPLENVKVSDELINATGRVVFTGLDDMKGIKFDSKENTVTITTLAPTEIVTLNCEYTVTREDCYLNNEIKKTDPNGAGIKNKAKVTVDPGNPTPVPDEETDPVGPSNVEKVYTLTIYYQFTNGSVAAPTVVREYLAGDGYTEYSPAISGYTWSVPFVTGKMPKGDLTLVVYYTAVVTPPTGGGDPDPDPDPTPVPTGTPGPSATPTPTPTTNTPPVIPVQPTPGGIIPVIIPVEPTVVAINDDPVPMGAIVDVDDDGNVTLIPITEDEIPLDNRELDDHKCCILSFLLMLLTLIIYTWFTHSMKKNQKKLEEMKDELAEVTLKRQLGITDENTNTGKSAQA